MQRCCDRQGAVEKEAHPSQVSVFGRRWGGGLLAKNFILSRPAADRRKHIHYSVKKGSQFATEVKQLETDLTADMIASYVPQRYLSSSRLVFALPRLRQLVTNRVISELTSRGNWKAAEFKQYNFAAAGQPTEGGALHPLLKVREEFRQIFFDMG